MSEEFDKQLRGHITDVFDNYEGTSADAGWALLREKYPERDKRRPFAWWWFGMAAGVLLIAGATLWLNNGSDQTSVKTLKTISKSKPNHVDTITSQNNAVATHTEKEKKKSAMPEKMDSATLSVTGKNKVENIKQAKLAYRPKTGNSTTPKTDNEQAFDVANKQVPKNTTLFKLNGDQRIDTGNTQKEIAFLLPVANTKTDTAAKVKKALAVNNDKSKVAQSGGKKVIWSAFVSGYDVISNSGDREYNMGGGFGADIRIDHIASFSTGLGIFKSVFNYSPTSGALYYAVPAGPSPSPLVSTYSSDLLSLELPTRISFRISEKGNYISTGFSSVLYINETYHERYNYSTGGISAATGVTYSTGQLFQDNITEKHLQTFVFAKSFDLMAGFGYSLGKNRLFFEPFVKLPVSTLGRKQLTYGSAGLDVKFSFGAAK